MHKDFVFAGENLRDYGMIICDFDLSAGVKTVTAGSEINWNQVSTNNGTIHLSTNATYDSVLETTFHICKYTVDNNISNIEPLSFHEQRELFRWLNRKEPYLFRLISDEDYTQSYVWFEGSFNISKIEINSKVYGYELHFVANRPFAVGDLEIIKMHFTETNNLSYSFDDESDEIGYIYPKLITIKCKSDGNLTIHNSIEDRTTEIKDCKDGEIITFDEFFNITDSLNNAIQDRFNFLFFRIANSYTNRKNKVTTSLPCEITIEYYPIIKGVSL